MKETGAALAMNYTAREGIKFVFESQVGSDCGVIIQNRFKLCFVRNLNDTYSVKSLRIRHQTYGQGDIGCSFVIPIGAVRLHGGHFRRGQSLSKIRSRWD